MSDPRDNLFKFDRSVSLFAKVKFQPFFLGLLLVFDACEAFMLACILLIFYMSLC